ncbi:MAG: DUF4080 domain-containing protein [Limnochordia bacterium]|jgi:anaerobic magnesium-protoporphyrin IX monomethyl ester cyclase
MRPLLVAINSMYIQTCLAVRCLHAHCQGEFPEIQYREYQVSEPISFIAGDIYQQGCNPIGFSCSIWNIVPTLQTASILKKVQEDLVIVLGGPEAGADPEGILRDHPYIDWIVCGEGETPFLELLRRMERGEELAGIPGLAGRVGSRIVYWPPAAAAPIPVLPYGKADDLKNRIAYIESSRGCPFRCSYCLSSRTPGVTYFPLGQVKHRLNRVMAAGPREIKFVDRTFNLDRKRTLAIWSHILARTGPPCHFEIEGRLLDDDMLRFLAQVPEGRFNFEVGVQSTDPAVLAAVNRSTDWGRPRDALVRLRRETNVHLTLDLIAGLPEQTPASFARSFNEVYHLQPHRLQLNFLKVLPGTDLRRDAHRFGLIYADHPPYEILTTKAMPYGFILDLKLLERTVERFYNSGRFPTTLAHLTSLLPPFDLFLSLGKFREAQGLDRFEQQVPALYDQLFQFGQTLGSSPAFLAALLRYDFRRFSGKMALPPAIKGSPLPRQALPRLLELAPDIAPAGAKNSLRLEIFPFDVTRPDAPLRKPLGLLFDYRAGCRIHQIPDPVLAQLMEEFDLHCEY